MKKLMLILLLSPALIFAQGNFIQEPVIEKVTPVDVQPKNLVRTNLFGWALKNCNVIYERGLTKKISVSLGIRYMPKSTVPLKSYVENQVNRNDFNIEDFKLGNNAITAELRCYLGKGNLKGFYIAPYLRKEAFNIAFPITNRGNNNTVNYPPVLMEGKLNAMSGGLMLGVQGNITKNVVIDFWLVGIHGGSSNGTLKAENIFPAMSDEDMASMQSEMDNYQDMGLYKFEGKVLSPTSAQITASGMWVGVRSGLAIGYRF